LGVVDFVVTVLVGLVVAEIALRVVTRYLSQTAKPRPNAPHSPGEQY
jgi:hypothetical protein